MMFSGLPLQTLESTHPKRYAEIVSILPYFKLYGYFKLNKKLGLTYDVSRLDEEEYEMLDEIDKHMVEEEKARLKRKSKK